MPQIAESGLYCCLNPFNPIPDVLQYEAAYWGPEVFRRVDLCRTLGATASGEFDWSRFAASLLGHAKQFKLFYFTIWSAREPFRRFSAYRFGPGQLVPTEGLPVSSE